MLFGLSINAADFVGLFLVMAGFVIGLGAVTVIDIHGFLARKSNYWTEATIRTHKVTKPLIWLGIALVVAGTVALYRAEVFFGIPLAHAALILLLVLNGLFLTFRVSPFLLRREKEGKAAELLSAVWQRRIVASFIISFVGWWGSLLLFSVYVLRHL